MISIPENLTEKWGLDPRFIVTALPSSALYDAQLAWTNAATTMEDLLKIQEPKEPLGNEEVHTMIEDLNHALETL